MRRTTTRPLPSRGLVRAALIAGALAFAAAPAATPGGGQSSTVEHLPHAYGDSAANIPLRSASHQVLNRWVARRSGVIRRLYVQIKVDNTTCLGGSSGYASGSSGVLLATTYAVRADGRPDLAQPLSRDRFVPCDRHRSGTAPIELNIGVKRGSEYATVIRNVHPVPASNYFSQNFLYQFDGISGANARNERDPLATDARYGLDPRELVGWSSTSGRNWRLPGGPYGPRRGVAFIPTYVQQYASGFADGQPYYYPRDRVSSAEAVYRRAPAGWTIRRLAVYTADPGSGTISLKINGKERARAAVVGDGLLTAPIKPVKVPQFATVTVSVSGSLSIPQLAGDRRFEDLLDLGTGHRFFDADNPRTAVPAFPVPMYRSASPQPPAGAAPRGLRNLRVTLKGRAGVARVTARVRGKLRIVVTAKGRRVRACGPVAVRPGARRACTFRVAAGVRANQVRAVAVLSPPRGRGVLGRLQARAR